ncbi:MAG: hypothetical protein Q27BB25_13015 [Blastomonas sp. CACIA14H2]|nr:MAG: hypothetical protein Q27BB25_13015 [Blastomonas sp. CACIA14H2]
MRPAEHLDTLDVNKLCQSLSCTCQRYPVNDGANALFDTISKYCRADAANAQSRTAWSVRITQAKARGHELKIGCCAEVEALKPLASNRHYGNRYIEQTLLTLLCGDDDFTGLGCFGCNSAICGLRCAGSVVNRHCALLSRSE